MIYNRSPRWQRREAKPLPLFDRPPARNVATSIAAAKSVAHAVGYIEDRIVAWLYGRGIHGATADECEEALDLRPQTGSARFSEMTTSGRILRTDRKRPTRSGRAAFVHVHPAHGGDGCSPGAA
jgi:hypothetical protein